MTINCFLEKCLTMVLEELFSSCLKAILVIVYSVSYQSIVSEFLRIVCGVPQGSVLGPILFILYINDTYRSSTFLKFLLFADDTTILCTGKIFSELSAKITEELKTVSIWFKANKLSLNISKTNYIAFMNSGHASAVPVFLDGQPIKQVTTTKFLGVEIDDNISWKIHVKKVEQKLASAIGVISKLRYKINKDTALLLYDTMVLPHLSYCNIVWASTYKTTLSKLFCLQKRALRICTSAAKDSPSAALFINTNKLTIYDINKFQVAKFIYCFYNSLLPRVFNSMFNLVDRIHQYKTRNEGKLFTHHCKTNIRKFSIGIAGPSLWNSIPINIKESFSLPIFESHLRKLLIVSSCGTS